MVAKIKKKELHIFKEELIKKFNPIVMAIEDTFHSINVKSALLLGQARGVLLLAAAFFFFLVPIVSYVLNTLQQFEIPTFCFIRNTFTVERNPHP